MGKESCLIVNSADIPEWAVAIASKLMAQTRQRDYETYMHCVRVSRSSRLLAQAAGMNELDQKIIEFAGLFHDIGKVHVPLEILNKPAKLTAEEFDVMKEHPELSVEMLEPLKGLEFFRRLIPGVLHHHERFDGAGYPAKMEGEDIPLIARMILVVDTYDAMTADRAYRKGLPMERAYAELKEFAGRQFDPQMVKIFLDAHPFWIRRDEAKIFDEMNGTVLKRVA
jgi:putative nucleotidyltransferase with HDIG domain